MKMKYLKLKILSFIALLAVLAFAQLKKGERDAFSLAGALPSGALIYAQFEDLPGLLKRWNESKLKRDYLVSTNFREFSNGHLALKLAERFSEYDEALGFSLDSATISSSSETKAAFAVYDIGRMEMVFIAPMSEEKILASAFFQNFSQFEESETEAGITFYSRDFEVDRQREKQTVLFANAEGYFVLATNKRMFFKTLENIKGAKKNDTLADEQTFKDLTKKVSPHRATFWINQEKLNNDWYFKRYWLIKNPEDIKKIRAGTFDFEIRDEGIFERRVFLLNDNKKENRQISPAEMSDLQAFIPNNAPFYKIEAGFDSRAINDVLFDENIEKDAPQNESQNYYRHFYDDYNEDYFQYYSLGSDFDAQINEIDNEEASGDAIKSEIKKRLLSELDKIFAAARPKSMVYLIEPQNLSGQMFFECRKAVIFHLQNPQDLNSGKLENVISELAQNRLMLGESKRQIIWKSLTENNISLHQLNFSMLRWNFFYAVKDGKLVISNSSELAALIFQNSAENKILTDRSLNNLTVIRLDQREKAFDAVMKKLKAEESRNNSANLDFSDFFVDNIGSLLDLAKEIRQIEIRRNYEQNYLFEELKFAY